MSRSDGEFLAPLGVTTDEVLALGRLDPADPTAPFSMAFLAFRWSDVFVAVELPLIAWQR